MKKLLLLTFAMFIWSSGSRAGTLATHGMVLVGKKVHYVSHLPMFHSPHDYQGIWKVGFMDMGAPGTIAAYQAAQAAGQTLFTIVPKPMDLTKMGMKSILKADLYSGHFEKDGTNLGPVMLIVEQVVTFKQLDASTAPSKQYVVFGEKGEYFAAHVIQGKPNLDAIVSVAQPYTLSDDGPCTRRFCPPFKSKALQDSKLPVFVNGSDDDLKVPATGEMLGFLSGIYATVNGVVYAETADLE